jgi:putative endonuclease
MNGVRTYFVYILASGRNGTLYIGVTNDLRRRVCHHRDGAADGFTKRYNVHRLVWFESSDNIEAIDQEKRMKHWLRAWKIALIEKTNPEWKNLYDKL